MLSLRKGITNEVCQTFYDTFIVDPFYHDKMLRSRTTIESIKTNLERCDWVLSIWKDDLCAAIIWHRLEINFCVHPEFKGKWATRSIIMQFANYAFANLDAIVGTPDSKYAECFMRDLGFVENGDHFYLTKELLSTKWGR